MGWMETFYNHLLAFTIHDLAQISDWLDEQGELYVEGYPVGGAGALIHYFVRSMQDVRLMALDQSRWYRISFTFFYDAQLPLRGIADAQLLQRALEAYPDGSTFWVTSFGHYPEQTYLVEDIGSHFLLVHAIAEEWGYPVAIGSPLPEPNDVTKKMARTVDVFSTPESRIRPPKPTRYAPYDANPARYQWIVDMWQE